jgi:hypothetical protein
MRHFQSHFIHLVAVLAVSATGTLAQEPAAPGKSTNQPPAVTSGSTNSSPDSIIDSETRELKARDTFRYRVNEDPVGGADSLRVTINDAGEALFNVTRSDSTYVTVKAAGRRLQEVRQELKQKLEAEFYIRATVDLSLETVASANAAAAGGAAAAAAYATLPKVVVYGELQGSFVIPEGQRLMLSDVMIGMPKNPFAALTKVEIQRLGADGKALPSIVVDVDSLITKNNRSLDVELKDGDRIRVPKKKVIIF